MRATTLSEIAYKQLKRDILSSEYKPGERLYIEKVSKKLDISMTPIKDAFRMLENEGMVTSIPNRGTFVAELSNRDVLEYCKIRLALESLAVDTICDENIEITAPQIKQLHELNNEVERSLHAKDKSSFILNDMKFHLKIVNFSKNIRLVEILEMFPLSNFLVALGGENLEDHLCKSVIQEHENIIEALINKERENLKKLLQDNIMKPHLEFLNEHVKTNTNSAT